MGSWKWILIRIPLIFFAVFTFSKWMLWNFYGTKAVLFLLKGPYPILRQFGSWAIWGCVCLFRGVFFSVEAFAFAILCGQPTSCCMLAVCAHLLCMHSWSCACLLCIQACCTYKLIVYARLLCMCECYVCTITMCAHLLCMHAWSCVCMLEGEEFQDPFPCSLWRAGGALGRAVCTSTKKVSMHHRCGCYTV